MKRENRQETLICHETTGEIRVFTHEITRFGEVIPPEGFLLLEGLTGFNSPRFTAIRMRSGLTQAEFGAKCKPKMGFRAISKIERGVRTPPMEQVVDFARVLKIEPGELLIDDMRAFSRAVRILLHKWEMEVRETLELPKSPSYSEISLMIRDALVFSGRVQRYFRGWR